MLTTFTLAAANGNMTVTGGSDDLDDDGRHQPVHGTQRDQ